jgi:ferredoxin/flavodoxin
LKFAIIYFSGTGVTEGYAQTIADELIQKGEITSLLNITTIKNREAGIDFDLFDAVIFGFPVYGGRLPTVAETWLSNLKGEKICSMFFTYGGRELEYAHQTGYFLLSKADFKVFLSAEFVGKHSFNVAQGWDLASDRPNSHDISIAKEFALESLKRFQSTDVKWDYDTIGFDYQPRVIKEIHGSFDIFFPYKTRDCRMCYRCEKECPTDAFNLLLGKATNGVCIQCMHCVTICPDNVIEVGDATELFHKFKTSLDLSLENVKNKISRIIY